MTPYDEKQLDKDIQIADKISNCLLLDLKTYITQIDNFKNNGINSRVLVMMSALFINKISHLVSNMINSACNESMPFSFIHMKQKDIHDQIIKTAFSLLDDDSKDRDIKKYFVDIFDHSLQ